MKFVYNYKISVYEYESWIEDTRISYTSSNSFYFYYVGKDKYVI